MDEETAKNQGQGAKLEALEEELRVIEEGKEPFLPTSGLRANRVFLVGLFLMFASILVLAVTLFVKSRGEAQTPTPAASSATPEAKSFKTFQNLGFGFELMYPDSWVMASPPYDIEQDQDSPLVYVLGIGDEEPVKDWPIVIGILKMDLEAWLAAPYFGSPSADSASVKITKEKVILGDKEFEKVILETGSPVYYLKLPEKDGYLFFDAPDKTPFYSANKEEIEKILASIKFN